MPIEPAKRLALVALGLSLFAATFSNSLFEIFSGAFLGLSLFAAVSEKRKDLLKGPFVTAAGVYLAVVLLTVIGSAYPAESLRGAFRVARCVLMAIFAGYLLDDERKFVKIFAVFLASAVFAALDAVVQGVTGKEWIRDRHPTHFTEEIMRVTGPFHHANDLAAYLSLAIFLFLGMLVYAFRKGDRRWIAGCLAGVLLLGGCLLWTYTRGAWVAVVFAGLLLVLFARSRALLIATIAAMVLGFALSPAPLQQRILSLRDRGSGTIVERRILWNEAMRMTEARPWLGHGINTYARIEPLFKSKDTYTDHQYAHNGYLQIAAETGWIGLAAFVLVILTFFGSVLGAYFRRREGFAAAAALSLTLGVLSFLIYSATDTSLQSLRLVSLFWISMGMAFAASRLTQRSR